MTTNVTEVMMNLIFFSFKKNEEDYDGSDDDDVL